MKQANIQELSDIPKVTPALRFDNQGPFVQPTQFQPGGPGGLELGEVAQHRVQLLERLGQLVRFRQTLGGQHGQVAFVGRGLAEDHPERDGSHLVGSAKDQVVPGEGGEQE